jgi:hypothetical protein
MHKYSILTILSSRTEYPTKEKPQRETTAYFYIDLARLIWCNFHIAYPARRMD